MSEKTTTFNHHSVNNPEYHCDYCGEDGHTEVYCGKNRYDLMKKLNEDQKF